MKLQKKLVNFSKKIVFWKNLPYLIVFTFFICYSVLSVVKHNNFLSGYDLSIIDQAIWKYSQFKNPITTSHTYFDLPIYFDHLEIIYILISPLYWILNDVRVLLIIQVLTICLSAFPVYWLTQKYKIDRFLSLSILVSYLSFFGFQFAVWSDFHSLLFGVCFLSFFIYYLETQNFNKALIFFLLAIISKEDIALLTFFISITYFATNKSIRNLYFPFLSIIYLAFVFYIYFPLFSPKGYTFANSQGIFSDLNPFYFFNSQEKIWTIIYSLGWFGFLPLFNFFRTGPFFGDLAHYFILGNTGIKRAHGIFLHYRSTTALLLVWPLLKAISLNKKLNKWYTGFYLLLCAAFFQYYLHLPISYLSKNWFWNTPTAVNDINTIIEKLPKDASVATQVNIAPHITHRDEVYTLLPAEKDFEKNSPCGEKACKWFRIGKKPEYIMVDTSENWDSRHFLTSREEFVERIEMLKKAKLIEEKFRSNKAILYKVMGKI